MTVLGTWYVLSDAKFTLAPPTDTEPFTFTLPDNFVDAFTSPADPAHRAVLSFALDTGTPTNLVFRITTTNTLVPAVVEQFNATYNSDVYHTVHETINIGNLVPGPTETNTITFERVSGTGTLEIGDLILWYKRNIDDTDGTTE